jgi:hypothetical protein
MTQGQTRQYEYHTAYIAANHVLNFKQEQHMPNHEYYDRFKDLVASADWLGAKVGVLPNQVKVELANIAIDADNPTDEECEQAEAMVQDWYLAVVFLLNSDLQRYGGLI